MKIPFRQGIVRYQTNNAPTPTPTFLQSSNGGSTIDLVIAPDPTIIAFANGINNDYLFEERLSIQEAWAGPFVGGTDYWLYWDIDTFSGARTFGFTVVEPITSATMPIGSVAADTHWFDSLNKVMKSYTSGVYVEKIRVFACKYASGGVIEHYALGTQVGELVSSTPGFILFDDIGVPVRRANNRRLGHFVTTESNFFTHASSANSIKLEAQILYAQAVENVAAYQCVTYKGYERIGFASKDDIIGSVVGIVREDLYAGEVGSFLSAGFLTNPTWNWTQPANTPLYCDSTGQVTDVVPQDGSMQEIGTVVSSTSMMILIKPQIIIDNDVGVEPAILPVLILDSSNLTDVYEGDDVYLAPVLNITSSQLTIDSAQISFVGGFDIEDYLDVEDVTNYGGILGITSISEWFGDYNYDDTTGILDITGTDTISNYVAILNGVLFYTDTVPGTRTLSWTVTDSIGSSIAVTTTLTVQDPPALSLDFAINTFGTTDTTTVTAGVGFTLISDFDEIVFPADGTVSDVTVTILDGVGATYTGTGQLSVTPPTSYTGTPAIQLWNPVSKVLTIAGVSAVSIYNELLSTLQFTDSTSGGSSPAFSGVIRFAANDGASVAFTTTNFVALEISPA